MATNSTDLWRQKLTAEQYRVCREGGTEAPFSGQLLHNRRTGEYHWVCCGALLFDSSSKFDSGCGWPSFEASISGSIEQRLDRSHGMVRTEILCKSCGSHLGHLFEDGPTSTGLRYCVNSVSLSFAEQSAE